MASYPKAGTVTRLRLRLGSTVIGNTSNSHHGEVRSKMWADLSTTRPQGLLGNLLAHAWMVRPLLLRTVACSYLRALPMRPDKTAAPFKPKAKKFRGSAALDETKMQYQGILRHPLKTAVKSSAKCKKWNLVKAIQSVPGRWSWKGIGSVHAPQWPQGPRLQRIFSSPLRRYDTVEDRGFPFWV